GWRLEPVQHVPVVHDLAQRATVSMLAEDIPCDLVLLCRPLEQEREQVRQHAGDCILGSVTRRPRPSRFAERVLEGVDHTGADEQIVFWIERRAGGVWVVGRAINPDQRTTDEPRPEDVIFEGYELEEALARANEALEDDVRVLEEDGRDVKVRPFSRRE